MALQRTLNMARQRQRASVKRIVRPAVEPRRPDNTVEEFRMLFAVSALKLSAIFLP